MFGKNFERLVEAGFNELLTIRNGVLDEALRTILDVEPKVTVTEQQAIFKAAIDQAYTNPHNVAPVTDSRTVEEIANEHTIERNNRARFGIEADRQTAVSSPIQQAQHVVDAIELSAEERARLARLDAESAAFNSGQILENIIRG